MAKLLGISTPYGQGIQYLQPVHPFLSGMSTLEQVEDNLDTFNNYTELSKEEHITIEKVVSSLKSRLKNGCTDLRLPF